VPIDLGVGGRHAGGRSRRSRRPTAPGQVAVDPDKLRAMLRSSAKVMTPSSGRGESSGRDRGRSPFLT
jgi:hypothetical protein